MSYKVQPVSRIAFSSVEKIAIFLMDFLRKKIAELPEGEFFSLALSGGNTPRKIFQYLSSNSSVILPWNRIRFFWVDERCVSPDSEDSNFKMTRLNLLDTLKIPEANIFRIFGEAEPISEAIRYGRILVENVRLNGLFPRFDLVILGLGEDGHTASIFPGATSLFQSDSVCLPVSHPQTGQKRITITGSVINNAETVFFLVTGGEKASVVRRIFQEGIRSDLPASLVSPKDGKLCWLLDAAAASEIDSDSIMHSDS